jgi:acyl-CoA synthetase (AMP-forming)/AMP-acid ligase II
MTIALDDLLPAALRRSWAADGSCPDLDLYSLFRARRFADPHRTAVIDAKGPLCYTALDRKVRSLAAGLRGLGVGPGDVVGVQVAGGRAAVMADLALAALGAVSLPFPVGRGAAEAGPLLRRAEAVAVIAAVEHRGQPHAAELRAWAAGSASPPVVVAVGPGGVAPEGTVAFSALLRTDASDFAPARPDPDTAARILVSSGSEAEPKMVAYSHNALAGGRGNFLGSLLPDATPPRCLFLVPLASAFGSNGTAVALARHGGTLVLLDRFTPEAALAALREHRPSHVFAVPTMVRMLLALLDGAEDRARRPGGPVEATAVGAGAGGNAADGGGTETGAGAGAEAEDAGAGALPSPVALVVGGAPLDAPTAATAERVLGCPVVHLYGSADGVNCHTGLGGTAAPAPESAPDGDGGGTGEGVAVGRPDPSVAGLRVPAPAEGGPQPPRSRRTAAPTRRAGSRCRPVGRARSRRSGR